ncbi:ParA family protein [Spirosoma luteum]|uniref:ParA family protein n=1 Tax=Spirosoma luteum TaxID=431553 RepID=UPI000374BFD1|nr:AAA family ATPase [Spirosoma luteum]
MSQSKVIAFSSQKGGAGKTTLTQLVATYLFSQQVKVLVIDTDFPQHSFSRSRQRDLLPSITSPDLLASMAEKGIVPYPIETMTMDDLIRVLPHIRTSTNIDVIFLDLPGTLNIDNFALLAKQIDQVIIPFELEFKSFVAGMDTIDFYQLHNSTIPISAIWTKLKTPHKVKMKEQLESAIKGKGVYVFESVLKEAGSSIAEQISTIFPLKHFSQNIVEELLNKAPTHTSMALNQTAPESVS